MPLQVFTKSKYDTVVKRTKRSVARISLDGHRWATDLTAAHEACKSTMAERATLAHRDKKTIVHKYRCERFTLVRNYNAIAHLWLAPSPLWPVTRTSCVSFGTLQDYSIWVVHREKEAFAFLVSFERSHRLLACPSGSDLYNDHNNLIFFFYPTAIMPDIRQSVLQKILQWVVRMITYIYVRIHIRGNDNIWADLLTRWSIYLAIRLLIEILSLLTTFKDFVWTSTAFIRSCQDTRLIATTRWLPGGGYLAALPDC